MTGVRIVTIPRKITKENEKYALDGYSYVGMELALRKYTDPRLSDQCCWVYEQRTSYKGYEELPDPLSIVGRVVTYDEKSFTVEIFRPEFYEALSYPLISISSICERDEENKTMNVKEVTGIYVGQPNGGFKNGK